MVYLEVVSAIEVCGCLNGLQRTIVFLLNKTAAERIRGVFAKLFDRQTQLTC
jgi:hypothetical protein